jgi:hypothetical protein
VCHADEEYNTGGQSVIERIVWFVHRCDNVLKKAKWSYIFAGAEALAPNHCTVQVAVEQNAFIWATQSRSEDWPGPPRDGAVGLGQRRRQNPI